MRARTGRITVRPWRSTRRLSFGRLLGLTVLAAAGAAGLTRVPGQYFWPAAGGLVALVVLGTVRFNPFGRGLTPVGILPGILVSLLAVGVFILRGTPWAWAVVGAGALLFPLTVLVEGRAHFEPAVSPFRLWHSLLVYLLGLASFVAIFGTRERSLFTATGVGAVSVLLWAALRAGHQPAGRSGWAYYLVIFLVMGELTWALNYWPISLVAGGGTLMLAFFGLTQLAGAHLTHTLDRRQGVEVVLVVGLLLAILWATGISLGGG